MKRLLLIRNAEHDLAHEQRWPEKATGLSEKGREQAIRIAKALCHTTMSSVYCSTHARAIETAEPLARRCSKNLVETKSFDPISLGQYEGVSYRDVGKILGPAVLKEIVTFPDAQKDYLSSGESLSDVAGRAWRGLLAVVETTKEDYVTAIYTHEEVIGVLLCRITGMPLKNVWMWGGRLAPANYGAITELLHDESGWKIVKIGCACIAGSP